MTYGRYVKAGLLGAALAVLVWLVVLAVPAVFQVVRGRQEGGTGSVSITIDSDHLLIAAVVGFAVGWLWRVRRPRA